MAYDVSALPNYVKRNSKEIATAAIMQAKTAALLTKAGSVQDGVKGPTAIQKLSNSVTFVSGAACARVAGGSAIFSERQITVAALRDNLDLCWKDLVQKIYVEELKKGQDPDNAADSVEAAIAEDRQKVIGSIVEQLIWKGDTTLSTNMKWIDGFLKIITASGTVITVTGADIIAKLQSFASQLDVVEAGQEDFYVFMGQDTYNALALAKFNKNYFAPGSENYIPGTTSKIEVVPGLNGTSKVIGSRLSNMLLGLDGDSNKAISKYDEVSENTHLDTAFAVGVQVIFPTSSYIAAV